MSAARPEKRNGPRLPGRSNPPAGVADERPRSTAQRLRRAPHGCRACLKSSTRTTVGALPAAAQRRPAASAQLASGRAQPIYNPLWPRAGAAKRRRSPWRPSPAARRLRRALAAAAETISARRPARSQPRPAPAPNSPPPPLSFRRRSAAPAPLRSPRARADSANCPPPGGFAPLGQPRRGDPAEASLASSFDVRPPSAQRARTPSRPCHARCVRCALPSCSAALQDGC